MDSINFDRAAEFYDATRGFPPGIEIQVTDSLLAKLPPSPAILEAGVGTGRIAIPLAKKTARLTGVDISSRMLSRLRTKLSGDISPPYLAICDATQLPFKEKCFDAVIIVHVIHLIPNWLALLTEAQRAILPGGAFIIGHAARETDSPSEKIRHKFKELVTEFDPEYQKIGLANFSLVSSELERMGARKDQWTAATWVGRYHLGQEIQNLADGIYSSAWRVPPNLLPQVIKSLRYWAEEEYGSLDRIFDIPRHFIWERYRWS